MSGTYPNLPLIEERFKSLIAEKIIAKKEELLKDNQPWYSPEFEIEVFRQVFPNTAGIFDDGGCSGQAFTSAYISVVHELTTDLYGVFGGNRCAYIVSDPPEDFFSDLKAHNMCTVATSRNRY